MNIRLTRDTEDRRPGGIAPGQRTLASGPNYLGDLLDLIFEDRRAVLSGFWEQIGSGDTQGDAVRHGHPDRITAPELRQRQAAEASSARALGCGPETSWVRGEDLLPRRPGRSSPRLGADGGRASEFPPIEIGVAPTVIAPKISPGSDSDSGPVAGTARRVLNFRA